MGLLPFEDHFFLLELGSFARRRRPFRRGRLTGGYKVYLVVNFGEAETAKK